MDYKRSAEKRIRKFALQRILRKAEKYDDRVKKLKDMVKKEDVFIDKCKEYNKSPSFIDDVKISFDKDLDVSAKTINGEVFLNESLFNDKIEKQVRYIIHELTHVMQQDAGKVHGKTKKEDYLDDHNEIEAFNTQLEYMCDHETSEEVIEYIENLLDHHRISGKERREKAKKLVETL